MWTSISEKYECSDLGEIRNKKTKRVLKQFIGKDGYIRTQFDGKTRVVHRVIAQAFVPKCDGKDFVNHIDGNKTNNNAKNLEWCTRSENLKHAYDHNLKTAVGINNSRCKLSEEDVLFIKEHYIPRDKVYGAKALAKKYNVAHQTICAVATGQNWSI